MKKIVVISFLSLAVLALVLAFFLLKTNSFKEFAFSVSSKHKNYNLNLVDKDLLSKL